MQRIMYGGRYNDLPSTGGGGVSYITKYFGITKRGLRGVWVLPPPKKNKKK